MPEKYKLCRLVDCKGDIKKEWYLVYYIWNNDTCEIERKRNYTINSFKTKLDRRKAAKQLKKEIDEMLKSGAYISKIDSEKQKFPVTSAANSTLILAIDEAIRIKKLNLKKNSMKGLNTAASQMKEFLSESGKSIVQFKSVEPALMYSFFEYLKQKKRRDGKQNLSNRTINNIKSNISTLFNFYVDKEEIKKNPISKIKKLKTTAVKHKPFSDEQMQLIREDLTKNKEDQFLFFIQCIYFTFLRPGEELRLLKVEDITAKTIQVPGTTSKNGDAEHVIIPTALEKILQERKIRSYPPEYYVFTGAQTPGPKPTGMKYFYRRNASLLKRLKLSGKNYDLYGYKHTGAIKLYNSCKDIKAVQKQCRHSTIQQTDTYLRGLGLITNNEALNFPEF
jgi:integrase